MRKIARGDATYDYRYKITQWGTNKQSWWLQKGDSSYKIFPEKSCHPDMQKGLVAARIKLHIFIATRFAYLYSNLRTETHTTKACDRKIWLHMFIVLRYKNT